MKREIWIFMFFLSLLLFNWPFINIFRANLSFYLFVVWILCIGLVYLFTSLSDDERGGR